MEKRSIELPELYMMALRRHLSKRCPTKGISQGAQRIGRTALALGVKTLALAHLHDLALVTLGIGSGEKKQLTRASRFFSIAVIPLKAAHQSAHQTKVTAKRVNDLLALRIQKLATANSILEVRNAQKTLASATLKKSQLNIGLLLKESLNVQKGLEKMTQKLLSEQEKGRHKISLKLQDEVVQALIAIGLKLESLEHEARNNLKDLAVKLTKSQQLVEETAKSVRRIARDICKKG